MKGVRPALARHPPAGDANAGFTLVEALVTMLVVSLLGAAMTASLSTLARTTVTTTSRVRASQQATIVIDRLTKAIRSATVPAGGSNAIATAAGTQLKLYVDYTDSNGPRLLNFYTTGGPLNATLHEDLTLANSSGAYTGATTGKIDSTDVNLSGTAPLLTYYDAAGTALAAPVTTAAGLAAILSIGITLTTQEAGLSTPVTTTTRVYVRNVQYH